MNFVHLTSSTFFGGPERQILGLAQSLPRQFETTIVSFSEDGRNREFLNELERNSIQNIGLNSDFPAVRKTINEIANILESQRASLLICHGYKANILGRLAARRHGIPAVAVSRGWTGENRKVKLYEWLDRRHLNLMDHVVCVSEGQAAKVRRWCRISPSRMSVIHNSARIEAFRSPDPNARQKLLDLFPAHNAISRVVLAAGRLSPEKGFGVLIKAATSIARQDPRAGIVIFGEGVLRPELERQLAELGLNGNVALPGFRADLDSLVPAADLVVLPSFTEGLPNIALEASAAGVPVVATAVGGTPEVITDRETGILVPPGNPLAIAESVGELLASPSLRQTMGQAGRVRMQSQFTFAAQAQAYQKLFARLLPHCVSQPLASSSPRMGFEPVRAFVR